MITYICETCYNPIPAGEAVIRSRSLERVTWHRDCFDAAQTAPVVRVQPVSSDERMSA